MPRKTCTSRFLLLPLGGLEEDRELAQVRVAERCELWHRRARGHAGRTLEVPDLEVDPEVLRADGGQVGRTEVRGADAVVGVARGAAGAREELRARDGVRRQVLVLDALRHRRDHLAGERLLRRRTLLRED